MRDVRRLPGMVAEAVLALGLLALLPVIALAVAMEDALGGRP